MNQAETLLNSLGDDISVFTAEPATEGHIVIGKDRYMTVPEELKRIAVQYDHNIETVTFDCPRYWDEHDMSTMRVYVNYLRPDGESGSFLCEPVTIDASDSSIMHFNWTLSNHATMIQGMLSFLVCVKELDAEGNELHHWNSELCTDVTVSAGLEVVETILAKYPDIITQLLTRMDSVEATQSVITGTQIVELQLQLVQLDNQIGMHGMTSSSKFKNLENEDARLDARIDELYTEITGVETAIAHSLKVKGVSVPPNLSLKDVAGLIDIIEMDVPTALRGITITTPPTQTEYYQGESFNKKGMVVTADFGDGVTIPVSSYTVNPAVMTEGVTEVVISLTVNGVTKTAIQSVAVSSVIADTMPLGALMTIAESDTLSANYRLVDTNYYGYLLFVREECLDGTVQYLKSNPNQAYLTKYQDSNLDTYLNNIYYSGLPAATAAAIQSVDIPISADGSGSAKQDYLNRKVFTLSSIEWGTTGESRDGEPIEYTSNRTTGVRYWTRELCHGVANTAYVINETGSRLNSACTNKLAVRPAFCISKNQPVKENGNAWVIAGAAPENPLATMSVDDFGNATITGVTFRVDAEGNATITM